MSNGATTATIVAWESEIPKEAASIVVQVPCPDAWLYGDIRPTDSPDDRRDVMTLLDADEVFTSEYIKQALSAGLISEERSALLGEKRDNKHVFAVLFPFTHFSMNMGPLLAEWRAYACDQNGMPKIPKVAVKPPEKRARPWWTLPFRSADDVWMEKSADYPRLLAEAKAAEEAALNPPRSFFRRVLNRLLGFFRSRSDTE